MHIYARHGLTKFGRETHAHFSSWSPVFGTYYALSAWSDQAYMRVFYQVSDTYYALCAMGRPGICVHACDSNQVAAVTSAKQVGTCQYVIFERSCASCVTILCSILIPYPSSWQACGSFSCMTPSLCSRIWSDSFDLVCTKATRTCINTQGIG